MTLHSNIIINEEMSDAYRLHISGLDVSPEHKDDLIGIVHAILSYFVDQAFTVQTDQITLKTGDGSAPKAQSDADATDNCPQHHSGHSHYDDAEGGDPVLGSAEP